MTLITIEVELLYGLERLIADGDEPPRSKMTYHNATNVIVGDWLTGQGCIPMPGEAADDTPYLEAARVKKV